MSFASAPAAGLPASAATSNSQHGSTAASPAPAAPPTTPQGAAATPKDSLRGLMHGVNGVKRDGTEGGHDMNGVNSGHGGRGVDVNGANGGHGGRGVVEVTSAAQFDELVCKHERVALDFGASWCQPCKKMAPVFHKLAEETKGVLFLSIDVDACEEVHERYPAAVQVPTFVFLHKGKPIDALTCGGAIEKLASAVQALSKL